MFKFFETICKEREKMFLKHRTYEQINKLCKKKLYMYINLRILPHKIFTSD